ncbi:MAG: glutamate--tRNA ligase [Pseudomonadota bacterium]|nr:glutamate--tRNA ligase [Pseudomonadota bacterium]
MVRTRFAPSPTGFLHIGGARTALFCWAYARRHGGTFVLRIEDTDLERSTEASVKTILDSMAWLGLDWDEGPFYQMQRLDRYREVAEQLLRDGHAYWCYASREELEEMRTAQRERGEKPRYDGRWRDSTATPPAGVKPVLRFRNPLDGEVVWDDLVKGEIRFANEELDDLVILRADGVPTYNFGVVVDDLDMNITHVLRGDDHVNNTPRQINLYRAIGGALPRFGHLPMILGPDGERMSKRHGAVSCTQYRDEGFLPEAVMNYLARLGWSHGNEEVFSMQQMVEWFALDHISRSPARFDSEKLLWLNQHYLKVADLDRLAALVLPFLHERDCHPEQGGPDLRQVVDLVRPRVHLIPELADAAIYFYRQIHAHEDHIAQHLTPVTLPVLRELHSRFADCSWERGALSALFKEVMAAHGVKMGQVGVPLRVAVCGEPQTPAIDAVLELIGRDEVRRRLADTLARLGA